MNISWADIAEEVDDQSSIKVVSSTPHSSPISIHKSEPNPSLECDHKVTYGSSFLLKESNSYGYFTLYCFICHFNNLSLGLESAIKAGKEWSLGK